ncbi:hypothetical protein NST84_23945 [Paenibacillus sp. FSL R7-0345]|uniref:hypothetical protein n=1 Tax=Paenibacillus sp. FSL R7-0345 TaxID=2954535 RepID=UPI003159C90A
MNIAGNSEGQVSGQGNRDSINIPKYARTAFDYVVIAACYLFMPAGLLLALVRLIFSHYKNYRKPVNYSLLYHAFAGGFAEIIIFIIYLVAGEQYDFGGTVMLISLLIAFSVLFLVPAAVFAYVAAVSRHEFSRLAAQYVQLAASRAIRHTGTISRETGQSESDVRRDLLYLQNCGVLDRRLVFQEGSTAPAAEDSAPEVSAAGSSAGAGSPAPGSARWHAETADRTQAQAAQQLPESVRCTSCGAQNTVSPGQAKSCDYCGTALSYG